MVTSSKVLLAVLTVLLVISIPSIANAHLDIAITKDALMPWLTTHDVQYLAESAIFYDMAQNVANEGKDAISAALNYIYQIAFDATPTTKNIIIGEGKGAIEVTIAGTHIGEFAGIPATGKNVKFPLLITYQLQKEWPYQVKEARIFMMVNYVFDQILNEASPDLVPIAEPFAELNQRPSVAVTTDILTGWLESLDLKYVTDDVVFVDMSTGDLFATNREELGQNLNWVYNIAFVAGIAEPRLTVGEGVGVVEFRLVGTHTGEFAGIPATGKEVDVPKVVVYELEENYPYRIKSARFYLMVNVLIDQLTAEK